MAHAGKIINGWVGVNLTNKEAESLVEWWKLLNDHVDSHDLTPAGRETYRAAANAIIQIEKAL